MTTCTCAYHDQLIEYRRKLHTFPEEGWSEFTTTAFLIGKLREYGYEAGINVTASHNPKEYNGYKVYGADGCQITLEVAAKLHAAIEEVDCFAVQPADFDAALAEGKIEYSSEKCLDDFVDAVYAQRVGDGAGTADLKLVYTPLNGSGLDCV